MRRARFSLFLSLLNSLKQPIRILDIGGTQDYWNLMGSEQLSNVRITLLNLVHQPVSSERFVSAVGDARAMPEYADGSFDVVFSNSVIEHVGAYDDQRLMANEVMRIGKRYFVQTPNKRFPIEPHFLFPFFQYLPVWLRAQMLYRADVGWYRRVPEFNAARLEVQAIQLLTRRRFTALFPNARLHIERFAGLPKSFVAYGGWG